MNSPKTVVEKLNLTKYPTKLILHLPEDVEEFKDLEFDSSIKKNQYDLIFIFVFHFEELEKNLHQVIDQQLLTNKGYLFFAYPKKNNRKYQEYIDRDRIINDLPLDDEGYMKGSTVKFSRMISLNDVFTVVGLKNEPKKAAKTASPKNSQCVDDYIENIKDIQKYLMSKEEILKKYNELTPGYQKDWARYVYSAKRKETQEKRFLEMETVLAEGYKSIELYKRDK